MKVRKGDIVQIIAGKDKGKQGEVYRVDVRRERVWVKGVNISKRHQKPTQANKQGGIIEKEMPLHISNVMLYDEKARRPSRVGYRFSKEGKVRYLKRSGEILQKLVR